MENNQVEQIKAEVIAKMQVNKIIQQNVLIDIYLTGRERLNDITMGRKRGAPKQYENHYNTISISDLKYHSSWEWLMPVLEKIENMNDDIITKVYTTINGRVCSIWNYFNVADILRSDSGGKMSNQYTGKTKMEAVYNACVGFIEWYNEEKTKQ